MTDDKTENPTEKTKEEKPTLKKGEITLLEYKIEKNLSNMDYMGLKSHLKNDDTAVYSKTKLNKALKEYAEKPAFTQDNDKEE